MRVINALRSSFLILFRHRKMVKRRITRTTRACLRQFLVDGKVARQRKMWHGKHSLRKTSRSLILMLMPFWLMTDTRNILSDSLTSNDYVVIFPWKLNRGVSLLHREYLLFAKGHLFTRILYVCTVLCCVVNIIILARWSFCVLNAE